MSAIRTAVWIGIVSLAVGGCLWAFLLMANAKHWFWWAVLAATLGAELVGLGALVVAASLTEHVEQEQARAHRLDASDVARFWRDRTAS